MGEGVSVSKTDLNKEIVKDSLTLPLFYRKKSVRNWSSRKKFMCKLYIEFWLFGSYTVLIERKGHLCENMKSESVKLDLLKNSDYIIGCNETSI